MKARGILWVLSVALLSGFAASVARAEAPAIVEIPLPYGLRHPIGITSGPGGDLWFAAEEKVGRMTPDLVLAEFALYGERSTGRGIASGADGNLWLVAGSLARLTPDGRLSEPLRSGSSQPETDGYELGGRIVAGPGGYLWCTLGRKAGLQMEAAIGRVSTGGQLTVFPLPTGASSPYGLAVGPEGNLWFTRKGAVGYITPEGQATEFPLPRDTATTLRYVNGIAAGSDGNLWFGIFIEEADASGEAVAKGAIGRITPTGQLTEFPLPGFEDHPRELALGPDGNVWFTDIHGFTPPGAGFIGRITPSGRITEFPTPNPSNVPAGITAGPDGNLWYTGFGWMAGNGAIGRVLPGRPGIQVLRARFPKQRPWAELRLSCAVATCRGSAIPSAYLRPEDESQPPTKVVLGHRRYVLGPETSRTVAVRLNRRAQGFIRIHPEARVHAKVDVAGGASAVAQVLALAKQG